MKALSIIAVLIILAGCAGSNAPAHDPIDELVQRLDSQGKRFWANKAYPVIEFPPDAAPKDVLAKAVTMWGFDKGQIKEYRILEVREVQFSRVTEDPYFAGLIDSDLGMKILLFKPKEDNRWWTMVYDIEDANALAP